MTLTEIIAQVFGIAGLIITVLSFQEKNNKKFFVKQAAAGLMFCFNYILIGAVSATLFNVTNLVRGTLFSKNDHKLWRLLVIESLYTICFLFSLTFIINIPFQILLSSLTYLGLVAMTFVMWKGNGKHIRYVQFCLTSHSWLLYNIFN